jgi:hypothetical protein
MCSNEPRAIILQHITSLLIISSKINKSFVTVCIINLSHLFVYLLDISKIS